MKTNASLVLTLQRWIIAIGSGILVIGMFLNSKLLLILFGVSLILFGMLAFISKEIPTRHQRFFPFSIKGELSIIIGILFILGGIFWISLFLG